MTFRLMLLMAAALLLGGCTAVDAFKQSFDSSFRTSCVASATKNGAAKEVAEKYCECALAKFKETKSMDAAAKACQPK